MRKQRPFALIGHSGVVGEGARGKTYQEPGRPCSWVEPNDRTEYIRSERRVRESAGPIVAVKRGNSRGAKQPHRTHAESKKKGEPLESKRQHYGRHETEVGKGSFVERAAEVFEETLSFEAEALPKG